MSSTLVETVSINYEDFNESFLTCGTCLCEYSVVDFRFMTVFKSYAFQQLSGICMGKSMIWTCQGNGI